jgi:hypothetical protein
MPDVKPNQFFGLVCLCGSALAIASGQNTLPDTRGPQPPRLRAEADLAPASMASHRPGTNNLGIKGTRFTINDQPVFLLGISYYGALGAPNETVLRDLEDMQRYGINWIRVWANWAAFQQDVAAIDEDGHPRKDQLEKLKWLLSQCDRRGMAVDLTLSRGNGVTGPARLQTLPGHLRAVETLLTQLRPWRNWYLDLGNERNIQDKRFVSYADLKALRAFARQLDPARLVTASHAGDLSQEAVREYLENVQVDFLAPHRPRQAESPGQTMAVTKQLLQWAAALGKPAPVHYQEPFRRDFGGWQPRANDFLEDLKDAMEGGAAGWCLHNGDGRSQPEGNPRRSFDLHNQRLFDQLDPEEQTVLEKMQSLRRPTK